MKQHPFNTDYDRHSVLASIWPASKKDCLPKVFALLDGVRDDNIEPLLANSTIHYSCLYSGKLTLEAKRAAPYLVEIEPDNNASLSFLDIALKDGLGIVYITQSSVTLDQLRQHCRRISKVTLPNKKNVNFRYYDPRILPLITKVSHESERTKILGPASSIIMFNQTYYYVASRMSDTFVDMKKDKTIKLPVNELTYHVNYGAGLVFRQEHLDVFIKKNSNTFFEQTFLSFLRVYNPNIEKDYILNGQLVPLKTYLQPCYALSKQLNLSDGYSVAYLFYLYIELGSDFLTQGQYRWINDILSQNRPAEARIEQIERKMSKQLMDEIW